MSHMRVIQCQTNEKTRGGCEDHDDHDEFFRSGLGGVGNLDPLADAGHYIYIYIN